MTRAVHTQFTARVSGAPAPTIMVSLMWRVHQDGRRISAGSGGRISEVRDKPANAPVMWGSGDTPFRFQRWYSGRLTIGGDDDFKVFVGQPGRGENTFWAFQEHFLPESEGVKATLIYRDARTRNAGRRVC